jgi:hypothetical protein
MSFLNNCSHAVMPCPHKFQEYLTLEKVTFDPKTLVVGTFNPKWPEGNPAKWFYGRTDNNHFWDVLPRLYGQNSLKDADVTDWKQFCTEQNVAITDLISCIKDADESNEDYRELLGGYSDKAITSNFKSFDFVDIVRILKEHKSIDRVLLTRGTGDKFWEKLWKPIEKYCDEHGIVCRTLMTPSGYAYYQQGRYNNKHPDKRLTLPDFILYKWEEKLNTK